MSGIVLLLLVLSIMILLSASHFGGTQYSKSYFVFRVFCCLSFSIFIVSSSYAEPRSLLPHQTEYSLHKQPIKNPKILKGSGDNFNLLAISNVRKVVHRGVIMLALSLPPGKWIYEPPLDGEAAIKNIQKAFDVLWEKSKFARSLLIKMGKSGPIIIIYNPKFPQRPDIGKKMITFALFKPSILVRKDGGKTYPVVIGRHVINWPTAELAWALGHELIGHGVQHLQNRLGSYKIEDLECEAFLRQELILQELGIWKNTEVVVRVRRQMENKWCKGLRDYITNKEPDKIRLWDVRNLDVPQLLRIFFRYQASK
ncbi:MAG: hypothetical protein HQL69_15215 [Magnetococcales bacterium]|nr:hypothetical protein [Magnetococcales bacterium]